MVEWSTNDTGAVHCAQGVVRCSRFLRSARVSPFTGSYPRNMGWIVKIYATTDMDAPINRGLQGKTFCVGEKQFGTLSGAKAWAETWLQH